MSFVTNFLKVLTEVYLVLIKKTGFFENIHSRMVSQSHICFRFQNNMTSLEDIPDTDPDTITMDHDRTHVLKLTRNLSEFQRAGMCCDVTLTCKDGNIMAHSGKTYQRHKGWINKFRK